MQLHAQLRQQSAHLRLYQRDIIEARVPMSRKINISMGAEPVCNFKEFVRAERDVFLGRGVGYVLKEETPQKGE